MMLSFDQAREIATDYLRRLFAEKCQDVVIIEHEIIEKPYGWIFPYQRQRYLETRKVRDAVIGGRPILIDKQTSKVVVFGSFGSPDYWCWLYENGKTREDPDGTIHLLFREDLKARRDANQSR
jgi:hypothetical protein